MNIIVPVDFSPASLNAAHFAVRMVAGQYDATLILLNVFDHTQKEEDVKHDLKKLKDNLLDEHVVKIETITEGSDNFIEVLEKKVRHLDASLVVMGLGEKSRLEQVLLGSNAIRMIEKNVCPVLVVPQDAEYTDIKNVAMASDFRDVAGSTPIIPVKKVLNIFKPNLHIVNINSDIYISLSEEYLEQRKSMQQMFAEFHPEFYFITTYDFHRTLQQFIRDKHIDVVLTFPRTRTFIEGLLKGSTTKKLVYESNIPVLAAHE